VNFSECQAHMESHGGLNQMLVGFIDQENIFFDAVSNLQN
jgi:hypothetical protein